MDVGEAIRKRRAVRSYTDRPVPDDVLDRVLSLGLRAPTGGGQQAWSFVVVRDDAKRAAIAELVQSGAGRYFATMRPKADGATDEEHRAWGADYAKQVLGSYGNVPVWILATVVPRGRYPESMRSWGHDDDVLSVAFAIENLMLAARAEGLGTVPTTAFWRFEEARLREVLGLPDEVVPVVLTPLGYPTDFPTGKPPSLAKTFRTWRSLVHDDTYGATRE